MKGQFKKRFKEQFGKHLTNLYLPALGQGKMFRIIMYHLMNVSADLNHTIHKMEITEIADMEFLIKVNNSIEIWYLIDTRKEAGHER
ncbi:hypothetical protein DN752_20970 [Echinicola strongylocentroti]|uniref:Uncharacterized protein n=1 Tax=Echinicola strongylocentroti TaxID=1795355 RepID=A0A2Z4INE8_9BACT|nr:hypothetical protein [Echinicola strongylocentroti]AWW32415.1 hypothetical protein DN752_20970 [Echinicola strongylocentroti]